MKKKLSIFLIVIALIAGMVGCVAIEYDLIITSTTGGEVTTPREGTSTYYEGEVGDLVAEAEEGYQFASWTGDVGIKAGDWVKLAYTFTGWSANETYPEWLKLEFLSVNGTIATVRFTQHISDGTEQSDTAPVDIVSGIEVPELAGIVIPANLTTGDSVYIAEYGNVTIEGEATKAYAGASRTVVYASFSQGETQVAYYWDKLTGVMLEVFSTYPGVTGTAKVTETNMWGATTVGMPWWAWIIVAVAAVGLGIFFVRRRSRGSTNA